MNGDPIKRDTPDEDAEVVLAAIRGDTGSWDRLVGIWSRRVYAAAQSRLHDAEAAEEVTQSVMVTVFEHLSSGRYQHNGRFESWLFRIAMNRVRDWARRTRRHRSTTLDACPDIAASRPSATAFSAGFSAGPSTGTDGTDRSQRDALHAALAQLPDADRDVLSLRHHAQLSFAAIADTLDQPIGTVLARHHRAIGKLRSMLDATLLTEETSR
ncbi:MAG: sigma-70 family RNA polymerase sigma factor [Planctomycetota bacterium]